LSVTTPPSSTRPVPRIWKAPAARTRWFWLALAIALYGGILLWYFHARATQFFIGPSVDPLRFFGIIAFLLVLVTATYSLRRRFVHGMPGMVRDWLQMHIWLGTAAVLIALLHTNFAPFVNSYCSSFRCFTDYQLGNSALFALILLVLCGIVGRLLDTWEARTVASEASSNGVGIVSALEKRMLELEYTVERLSAGKSQAFQQYCLTALESGAPPASLPMLSAQEEQDFHRARTTLTEYANLMRSLHHQQQAKRVMRAWRYVYIVLAVLAMLVILYHGLAELFLNVLHL
jgi:hypothetical protein